MNKKFFSLISIVVIIFVLIGCASKPMSEDVNKTSSEQNSSDKQVGIIDLFNKSKGMIIYSY